MIAQILLKVIYMWIILEESWFSLLIFYSKLLEVMLSYANAYAFGKIMYYGGERHEK